MRLFRATSQRSEGEYIESVRLSLARFDRWRPWILGLYGTAAIAFCVCLVLAVVFLERGGGLFVQFPFRWQGLVLGLTLGASLGVSAIKVGHGLGLMLFGLRNERLLVKYYDEVQEIRRGPEGWEEEDVGPR
jgi:hypothetical protein